jgi:signal transduction histidine kinase/ActR/RegA family two-component response regulator
MQPTAPLPGNYPLGSSGGSRTDGGGRGYRRRDDRDPGADIQTLLDLVPGLLARFHRSPDGRWSVPFASSDFARLCGIGLPALREDARLLAAKIHADDLARLNAAWALQGELMRSFRDRVRVRQPDGHWRVLDASATAEPAVDGGLQWNCVLTDLTHEAALDADVHHQLTLWQQAAEAAEIGIVDIQLDERLLHLDSVACRHHGFEAHCAPLAFEDWLSSVVPADRQTASAMLVAPARPQERLRQALGFVVAGSDEARTLEFTLRASADSQHLLGVCTDVTGQPRDEASQPLTGEARAPLGKADFMSRVSHQLRTPLNGILGFAQLMAMDAQHPLAPAQAQRLDILRNCGQRLLSMVDQLLDVSRIEQGRLRLRNRPIDLRLLIERCAVEIMPLARQRGIELRIEIPLGAPAVRADPEALEQVVTNLLSNAIRYNRPQGRVRIRHEVRDQWGVLTVDDTGIGMSAAEVEKLFEPFNRLSGDGPEADGSGLGLVITRKLVRAMGGEIEALSQIGRGSRFAVSLPLAAADGLKPTAPAGVTEPPERPGVPPVWGEGVEAVVLYVEHDETNVILMQQIFSTQPGWRLLVAADGAEALKLARQHELSLALLDLNLPGMSGLEVRERLRAEARTRQLRCIAFSADALPHQIQHALAQGFDDYWTKPVDVAVLLAKLKYEFRTLAVLQGSNSGADCR